MALDGVTCILISFESRARGRSGGGVFCSCPCFSSLLSGLFYREELIVKMGVIVSALELRMWGGG